MSARPMMACSDRRPMFPVVHWMTRRGRSDFVLDMGVSSMSVRCDVDTIGRRPPPALRYTRDKTWAMVAPADRAHRAAPRPFSGSGTANSSVLMCGTGHADSYAVEH